MTALLTLLVALTLTPAATPLPAKKALETGYAAFEAGRFRVAQRHFERGWDLAKASDDDGLKGMLALYRGYSLARQKRKRQAITWFRKAAELTPWHLDAVEALASALGKKMTCKVTAARKPLTPKRYPTELAARKAWFQEVKDSEGAKEPVAAPNTPTPTGAWAFDVSADAWGLHGVARALQSGGVAVYGPVATTSLGRCPIVSEVEVKVLSAKPLVYRVSYTEGEMWESSLHDPDPEAGGTACFDTGRVDRIVVEPSPGKKARIIEQRIMFPEPSASDDAAADKRELRASIVKGRLRLSTCGGKTRSMPLR